MTYYHGELHHYGVLGMKWGVRKAKKKKDNTMTYYDDELYHYGKKGMKWKKHGRKREDSGESAYAEKHGEGLGTGPHNPDGYEGAARRKKQLQSGRTLHNTGFAVRKKRFPNATAKFILNKKFKKKG